MIRRLLIVIASFGFALPAAAQDYPARPIKIVVPFPAGGSADYIPRLIAEKLSARLGKPVIIENRVGAAGNIGAEYVYKAEPDGYTLLSAPPPPLVINASLYPKLAFDPTQFVPVTVLASIPNVLLVNPRVPVNSVPELIAYARAHPGVLNYSSQGSGSTAHLTAEMFKSMAGGLDITHIPYKGEAPAVTDLLAGQVDLMFNNLGVSSTYVKSGRLKALAVCSEKRVESLPDVPALSEFLPGFSAIAWYGVVAPPKTPLPLAEKLSAAIAEILKLPDVQKRLAEVSAEPVGNTPAQMAEFMKQDAARWRAVIRSAGVKVD